MASNETTYNEELVTTLLRNINTHYGSLKDAIGDEMQKNVLDKLAEVWYMTSAVNYWSEEVSAWNSMCTKINDKFKDIYTDINTCADNYAKACGTSWRKPSWTGVPATVASNFKEVSADGKRGITDHGSFDTYRTTNIDTVKQNAETALNQVLSACGNSGFVDGGTQAQIESTVTSIKAAINKAIETAKTDIVKNSGTAQTNVNAAVNANSKTSS